MNSFHPSNFSFSMRSTLISSLLAIFTRTGLFVLFNLTLSPSPFTFLLTWLTLFHYSLATLIPKVLTVRVEFLRAWTQSALCALLLLINSYIYQLLIHFPIFRSWLFTIGISNPNGESHWFPIMHKHTERFYLLWTRLYYVIIGMNVCDRL